MKLYNFSELESQIFQRRDFKLDFTGKYKKKLDEHIVDKRRKPSEQKSVKDHEEDRRIEERAKDVPDPETEIVEEIINKFMFLSDAKH